MSVNKVILVGNVGRDPEVRYLEKDVAVANFPLATTERGYKTSAGVEVPDRTEWHNIVCWRGLATVVERYVKKGTQLYIEGKLRTRSYEQDGVKKYTTEIFVDELQMLGKRGGDDNSSGGQENTYSKPASQTTSTTPPATSTGSAAADANSGFDQDSHDDLPF